MAARISSAVFASYNIHKCVGTDRRFDPARIAAVIAEIGADVIASRRRTALRRPCRSPRPRVYRARRRSRLGAGSATATAATAGTATSSSSARGVVDGLRQIKLARARAARCLVVDLDLAMGKVRVVAAHLGLLRHSRLLQVEALLAQAGESTDRPVVLMGDLNEWRLRRRSALRGFSNGLRSPRPRRPELPRLLPGTRPRPGPHLPHGLLEFDHRPRHAARRGSPRTTCRSAPSSASTRRRRTSRAAAPMSAHRGPPAAKEPGHDPAARAPRRHSCCCRSSPARQGRCPSRAPTPTTTATSPTTRRYASSRASSPSTSASAIRAATGCIDRTSSPLLDQFYWTYSRAAN